MADFEWVRARAECSIGIVFQKLKDHVKGDMEKRLELREKGERVKFQMGEKEPADSFSVYREGEHQGVYGLKSLKFVMQRHNILVVDDNDVVQLSAALTLDNEGLCKLQVKGENLEEWQFRKMALENLFFGE